MTSASLLPTNATALEQAAAKACAPTLSPAVLRTLHDPAKLPAALLPWLGWGENVPLWPESEVQQRDLIARSRRLHGLIGTSAGLREIARLTQAEITRIIRTPAKTFLGGWSEADRKAWLASHPQLRLYPRRSRATAQSLMLGYGHMGESANVTEAVFRATTRAVLVTANGEQRELTTREWHTASTTGNATLEVARRSTGAGLHLGAPLAGAVVTGDANTRLWTLNQSAYRYGTATLKIRATTPTQRPLSTDVEIVAERAVRPAACLAGLPISGIHLCKLDGELRYYRRTYLHDETVNPPSKAAPAYLGDTRLGMPPFHAQINVKMPERHSHSMHIGSDYCGTGATCARDAKTHMEPTMNALNWMRAEADKLLIKTRQRSDLRARQTVTAGTVIAGQILD